MLWLFRLNAVQLVSTFHKLVVRLNQTVVLRVVIAQNHARIDHIALEVDSLGPQRQFVAARIAIEPALVKVVARGLAVIEGVADVEHHRGILTEELLQHEGDNAEHVSILRGKRVVLVGDKEVVGLVAREIRVFVEADAINDAVLRHEAERHVIQLDAQ